MSNIIIKKSTTHKWSLSDFYVTSYHSFKTSSYNYEVLVPIENQDTPGVIVKELQLDICSGKKFYDDKGNEHQIDLKNMKLRPAPIHTKCRYGVSYNFFTNVLCSNQGTLYYKDTKKPTKMSDSNGILRYKETIRINRKSVGIGIKPYELCLEAFTDSPEDIKIIEDIWYTKDNKGNLHQIKFNIKSPAKMDNPNKADCKPIICDETKQVIYNERQYSFAKKGVPNRKLNYPKDLIIDGHQFRYATEEEATDIFLSYCKYRDNLPKEVRDIRYYYDRKNIKGEVTAIKDSLVNYIERGNNNE